MRDVMFRLGKFFGRLPKVARWVVVLLIGAGIVWSCTPTPPPPKTAGQLAEEQRQAEINAAALAKQAAEKAQREMEFRIMVAGAKTLKRNMRDPDSFKLESVIKMTSGAICYEYRAKNGFGGYNREAAVYQPKSDTLVTGDSATRTFNALCAGKTGEDHTSTVKIAIE